MDTYKMGHLTVFCFSVTTHPWHGEAIPTPFVPLTARTLEVVAACDAAIARAACSSYLAIKDGAHRDE